MNMIQDEDIKHAPIKAWIDGVQLEDQAMKQIFCVEANGNIYAFSILDEAKKMRDFLNRSKGGSSKLAYIFILEVLDSVSEITGES